MTDAARRPPHGWDAAASFIAERVADGVGARWVAEVFDFGGNQTLSTLSPESAVRHCHSLYTSIEPEKSEGLISSDLL